MKNIVLFEELNSKLIIDDELTTLNNKLKFNLKQAINHQIFDESYYSLRKEIINE